MAEFLMFYAPFVVIIGSIAVAFWLARKDGANKERE
ncbi:cytochrome bd oxidase small subunit CydS [Bacillus sp. JJ1609]